MTINKSILRSSRLWNTVFAFTMLVYAVGLFIPIMEPDAAVYAQVSMEMHDRGDYLSIYHKGIDWLDKPHFPFWMSALSYEVFGVNAFAYKLPAVFFILLAALYTYLFARRFYSALHGWLAVIVLITAEHIIISNQDVRAEPFMTGLMIMGLYHFASLVARRQHSVIPSASEGSGPQNKHVIPSASEESGIPQNKHVIPSASEESGPQNKPVIPSASEESGIPQNKHVIPSASEGSGISSRTSFLKHILLGSLACACLLMTKGLFTLIPIASGIGLTLMLQKNWKAIFHWQWLLVAALIIVFISPALYGYYRQFDLHPEKTVFGEHNVSGVKFFLWTSQWGRFTNTGPIKGKGDITFFIHTMLWAFLPWAFAAFFALFKRTKQLIKKIPVEETFTYFGFITLFLIFSASKFQLSFYLNPLFPLLSIITVSVLLRSSLKTLRTFSIIHFVLALLLIVGVVLLQMIFSNGLPHIDSIVIVLCGIALGIYIFIRSGSYIKKIVFATALVVLAVNYYVNRDFYPALMKYQAESEAAYFMKDNGIAARDVVFVGEMESVADVILHGPTKVIAVDSVTADDVADKVVFTSAEGRAKINSFRLNYSIIDEFDDFPVTRLNGKFINKKTRASQVEPKYLLRVGSADGDKPEVEVTIR